MGQPKTGESKIYVSTVDGTSKRAVTTSESYYPVWSRDGKHLYHTAGTRAMYDIPVETESDSLFGFRKAVTLVVAKYGAMRRFAEVIRATTCHNTNIIETNTAFLVS